MKYYLDLFSPETYEAFSKSDRTISGFRQSQESYAKRIKIGDKLICYMTKLSRFIGVLEVTGKYFIDNSPIFYPSHDPFVVRFKVKTLAWLPKENAIPIKDERVWDTLSFTKGLEQNSTHWTGKVRNSLNQLDDNDGKYLEKFIFEQLKKEEIFEIDEKEYEKLITHKVHRLDKVVSVTVPKNTEEDKQTINKVEERDSIKIQALLGNIGSQMGLKIWIPKSDRGAVLSHWNDNKNSILDILPLNYDETTLKTIEQIDVLWLRGRAIVRAFEVEHTTSIYSGILRMADLLALQPNMNIKLHIVAPYTRKEKVFQEIRRPVFSLLDEAPLSERCTYLSYDSIEELSKQKHLSHLSDSVVDEYTEEAE